VKSHASCGRLALNLQDDRNDHWPSPVLLIDPLSDYAAGHLLQLVGIPYPISPGILERSRDGGDHIVEH
jgi:hypothetical protein